MGRDTRDPAGKRSESARYGDLKARGAPGLPAEYPEPTRSGWQLRRRGRSAGQSGVRWRGEVRVLPRGHPLHRCPRAAPLSHRGRERARAQPRSELRLAERDQDVPVNPAPRAVAARSVFPQWSSHNTGWSSRGLQHAEGAQPHRATEGGPRTVSEVAVNAGYEMGCPRPKGRVIARHGFSCLYWCREATHEIPHRRRPGYRHRRLSRGERDQGHRRLLSDARRAVGQNEG